MMNISFSNSQSEVQSIFYCGIFSPSSNTPIEPVKYFKNYNIFGNTVQIDTPAPEFPIGLNSTGQKESKLILNAGGNNVEIPLAEPLKSLPNGITDDLEYKNIEEATLNGNETWQHYNTYDNAVRFRATNFTISRESNDVNIRSNRFVGGVHEARNVIYIGFSGALYINIIKSHLEPYGYTDDLSNAEKAGMFKLWLTDYPVTIMYQIEKTPQNIILSKIQDLGESLISLNEIQPSNIIYERENVAFSNILLDGYKFLLDEQGNLLADKNGNLIAVKENSYG